MNPAQAKKLSTPIKPEHRELFSGRVYQTGHAGVSIRNHSGKAKYTVIAVHGFLLNHCYFTHLYHQPDTELILMTCSNYHIPTCGADIEYTDWWRTVDHPEATVEYDADVLNQILENLPTGKHIRVHGHSRGGSVILEGMRQRPELYKKVEVVLEAPVLPQGKLHGGISSLLEKFSYGMWPYLIRFLRRTPLTTLAPFFGKMNERKRDLLATAFSNPKDQLTIIRNIESIKAWMENTDFETYKHMKRGTILVPETDRILERDAMLFSSQQTSKNVHIVETSDTSHLISLDSDIWVPPLSVKAT